MECKVIYVGVDPGKAGFITCFDGDEYRFWAMPTHKVGTGEFTKTGKEKTETKFDERGLMTLHEDIKGYYRQKHEGAQLAFRIAIEEVGGRGGWSATNNFNFGYVAGLQKGAMIPLGPVVMIRPQKWQSYMRKGYTQIMKKSSTGKTMIKDPKAMAQFIVDQEFPDIDFRKSERARNNDDNKIDSFLICTWLYRKCNE